MFDIQTQLFEGQDIRFGPIDYEKDPEIESRWTHDSEFMRMYEIEPARPMSAAMLKKRYEKIEKEIDEDKNVFYFTIRAKEDDRLIGKAVVNRIEWSNGNGWIRLGIGAEADRRKGYGSQALEMLLRFAFAELNMYRVTAPVQEYNEAGIRHAAELAQGKKPALVSGTDLGKYNRTAMFDPHQQRHDQDQRRDQHQPGECQQ